MSIAEEFEFYKHEAGKVDFYRDKACELYEELKHYKDLEKQGRLKELPCEVGDTVYLLDFEEQVWEEATVEEIVITDEGFEINSDYEIGTPSDCDYIFYSEEELKAKLKELNGETNWFGNRDNFLEGEPGYAEADKLAHYEDLEEKGLLLELPCKVGDTVWAVLHNEMLYWDGKPKYQIKVVKFHYGLLHEFGRRVFLTKEEAEAKLAELRGTEE